MSFAYYDEDTDQMMSANLSPAFISFLDDAGYTIHTDMKLGQGGAAVAFQGTRKEDNMPVALVITPWDTRPLTWFEELYGMMKAVNDQTHGVAHLFDYMFFDEAITTDSVLSPELKIYPTSVQVMELLPQTLAEYMYTTVRHESLAFKAMFIIDIYKQLRIILENLAALGLTHNDLIPDNIGFTEDKRCVLIDLESIRVIDFEFHVENMVLFVIRDICSLPHLGEDESILAARKEWKLLGGICNDLTESETLLRALKRYIN